MSRKVSNYIEIEEACNSLFVSTEEIKIILGGVSQTKADNWRRSLERELDQEKIEGMKETDKDKKIKLLANCFYYKDTKPHLLPIKRVLEKAHVDLDYVRKEANKMRKAMRIEGKYDNENKIETKAIS